MTGSRNRRPQLPRHPGAPVGPSPPSATTGQPRRYDASAVQHRLSSRTEPSQQTPLREARRVRNPSGATRDISRGGTSRTARAGRLAVIGQALQSSHPDWAEPAPPGSTQLTPTRFSMPKMRRCTLPRTPAARSRREAAIGQWPPCPNRASSSCTSTALGCGAQATPVLHAQIVRHIPAQILRGLPAQILRGLPAQFHRLSQPPAPWQGRSRVGSSTARTWDSGHARLWLAALPNLGLGR